MSDSDSDWEEILIETIIYTCIFCKKEFTSENNCKNHQQNCFLKR